MPLEYMILEPYNRCGAAIISIASLVERLAIARMSPPNRTRTFGTWREVLAHIKRHAEAVDSNIGRAFRTDGDLRWPSSYLELDANERIGLTGRNLKVSLPRLEVGVRAALMAYLADAAPLQIYHTTYRNISNPSVGDKFLQKSIEALSLLSKKDEFSSLVTRISPVNDSANIIRNLLIGMFSDVEIPDHPEFHSLKLTDELLIKSEFLSVRSDIDVHGAAANVADIAGGTFTLYAVLREARGWYSENPDEVNMIVRDLLWIRSSTMRQQYTQRDVGDNNEFIGVYVSAMDRSSFYVERIDIYGMEAVLTAKENNIAAFPKRLTLILPASAFAHELQIRHGILSGSARRTGILAAWKCLLIRPHWGFLNQLRTITSQMNPERLDGLYKICSDISAAGILFSDNLRKEHGERIHERREVFRRVAVRRGENIKITQYSLGEFIANKVEEELSKVVDQFLVENQPVILAKELGLVKSNLSSTIIKHLNDVAFRFHHLIDPVQIINYHVGHPTRSLDDMPRPLVDDVEILLDTRLIAQRTEMP